MGGSFGPGAQLLILLDTGSLRIPIAPGITSIGAAEDSVIVVSSAGVAPRHCILQSTPTGFEIFDLFSETGTFVNGQRVEAAALAHGDQIQLGKTRLVFLANAPPPVVSEAPEIAVLLLAPVSDLPKPESTRSPVRERLVELVRTEEATIGPAEVPDYSTDPSGPSWREFLIEGLKRTPGLLISLLVHALIFLILSLIVPSVSPRPTPPVFQSTVERFHPDEVHTSETEAPPADIEIEAPPALPEVVELDSAPVEPSLAEAAEEPIPAVGTTAPFEGKFDRRRDGEALRGAGGGALAGSLRRYADQVSKLRDRGLDLVIVLDSTGSMGDALDQARKEVGEIITLMKALSPGFRLSLVTYRDKGDAYVTRMEPLTTDAYRVVHFLDSIEADGGGDEPEAVRQGLAVALRENQFSPKSKRIALLIGDASPHRADENDLRNLVSEFKRNGGVLHALVSPRSGAGPRGLNSRTMSDFKALTDLTGGSVAPLAAADAIASTLLAGALNLGNREELQKLLDAHERDFRRRQYREAVASEDSDLLLSHAMKTPPPPALLEILVSEPSVSLVPLYRNLLRRVDCGEEARSAALVALTRVLGATAPDSPLFELLREARPERGELAAKAQDEKIREGLRRAGLPTEK